MIQIVKTLYPIMTEIFIRLVILVLYDQLQFVNPQYKVDFLCQFKQINYNSIYYYSS